MIASKFRQFPQTPWLKLGKILNYDTQKCSIQKAQFSLFVRRQSIVVIVQIGARSISPQFVCELQFISCHCWNAFQAHCAIR